MNAPRIEQQDRGIVLNKSLAWTIAVGILSGGLWMGSQQAELNAAVKTMSLRQAEDRQAIAANTARIAEVRLNAARVDERLGGIEAAIGRTEVSVSQILLYLRDGKPTR